MSLLLNILNQEEATHMKLLKKDNIHLLLILNIPKAIYFEFQTTINLKPVGEKKKRQTIKYVANLYAQKTIKKKTQYSGPHLFGLHLEILQQSRDACRRVTVLKPFDNLTPTGQNNRAKQITKSVCNIFNQIAIEKCHPEDNPKLKSIELDIKNKSYQISIGKENTEEIIHKAKATVQACNKGQVAREGYRTLASIS
ncbi:hypothetical protein Glove_123g22 [Diversispora epigaea]|uniref:Uncharacterized protein n=1 Tax=Diversispora epigaea TaxID=1348612 RepID=A0A397J7G2_9GLOM|nr:hypothetical protein Glove_123g22 [Diversispora epigaea]